MAREEQIIRIKIDTSSATKSLGGLNKSSKKTGKTVGAQGALMSGAFNGVKGAIMGAIPALRLFSAALISTGVGALVVLVGSLIAVVAKASTKAKEFSKAVSTLQAISGESSEVIGVLTQQAKQLGSTTIFTASQVVELQTELAKLGFAAGEIQQSTPAILNLASALDISLAEAASFAGSQVRAFGLDASETQRVVDVFALSTTKSALDFSSLTESLKMAAPIMKATDQSIEKTAAMLGVLADTGLKGSIAGTGLSKVFMKLNEEGLTLDEAMEKVRTSTNQLGTATELVGIVGAKSLLNLANSGEKIEELEETFKNASDTIEQGGESFDGAAEAISAIRFDNIEGDTLALSSAWEGFLLSIEDGDGIIMQIQRGAIQLLTKGIQGLQTTIQFLSFAFKDAWDGMKVFADASGDIIAGSLMWLGGQIKKFANLALIQFSKIPIIGSSIDVAAAQKRVNEAAKVIDDAEAKIREGRKKLGEQYIKDQTFMLRFQKSQETKALEIEQKKQNKALEELRKQQSEEERKAAEEAAKERERQLKKLGDLEKKYLRAQQDLDDTTALEKAQRKRERAQEELDALNLSNEEKKQAQLNLNAFFDQLEAEAEVKDEEKKTQKEEKEAAEKEKKQEERLKELELDKEFEALQFEERRAILEERRQAIKDDELLSEEQKLEALNDINKAEQKLEDDKVKAKMATLDAIVGLAGAETGVGKALLIAKQMLQMKEMIMDLKKITFKGKKAIGEAAIDAGTNVSKSSAIGFPQNIITIAAAIGQGIAIIKSVKSAVSKSGGSASGASANAPNISTPARPTADSMASAMDEAGVGSTAPAFNVIGSDNTNQLAEAIGGQSQQPIKTYVVANDVTTQQALDRNTNQTATISE